MYFTEVYIIIYIVSLEGELGWAGYSFSRSSAGFRQQVGIVHKRPEFFNTSIADNIAFGKSESTLKEIVRAAKDAGAHEFIMALPHVS